MDKGRDLKKEIDELGIIAIEDYGIGSLESTFAALDAIREYEKKHPYKKKLDKTEEIVHCTNS
ncbi:MAG: hypothetical protein LBC80_06730 [Treponema sp.]|jgi:hypothetical protein|nr:hypothetical protein [Treponema sp.]